MLQNINYYIKVNEFCHGEINIYDHVEIVHNKTFDICKFCGIFLPGTEHYKNNHFDVSGLLKCCLCLDEIRKFNYSDLVHHLNSEHKNAFKCGFCPLKCSDYDLLKDHHSTKHSKIFYCNFCSSRNLNLKKMESHLAIHFIDDIFKDLEIKETKNLKCFDPACEHISESESDLKAHFKNHFGKREFSCEFCTFGSNNKSDLNVHVSNDHKIIFAKLRKFLALKAALDLLK